MKAKGSEGPRGPVDDLRIRVADANDLAVAALCVKDAGKKSSTPLVSQAARPLDHFPDRLDVCARTRGDLEHRPSTEGGERCLAGGHPDGFLEIALGSMQGFIVRERKPEPVDPL